jgi:hypothetical protein
MYLKSKISSIYFMPISALLSNTIMNRQLEEPPFKPEGFNRVSQIKPEQLEKLREEKKSVFRLGRDLQV